MLRPGIRFHATCVLGLLVVAGTATSAELELTLQTRNDKGEAVLAQVKLDPARVGIVVVDMWNYHWCKTATMRVDALVPRMNHALDAAREMGMTVMLCPSDVVDNYVGWPQRRDFPVGGEPVTFTYNERNYG